MNILRSVGSAGSPGTGRATVIGGDETALREFLAQSIGAFGLMGDTTVYIGQLPPQKPDIPIPPGAQIAGSIVRGTGNVEILTIINAPVEQAHAACEQLLLANGWQRVEEHPMGPRGFVDSPVIMRRYCNETAKASAFINAGAADNGSTTLRLNVSHEPNPCAPRGMGGDIFKFLPNLRTPPGVKLILGRSGMGGSGGNPGSRSASSSAALVTDLPLADVAQAYHAQLTDLGWQQVAVESAGHFAASSWVMTQDDLRWSAFFTLAADPIQPDEYQVWLYLVERAEQG